MAEIECVNCGYTTSYVIATRSLDSGLMRRRKCKECAGRISTVEIPMSEYKGLLKEVYTLKLQLLQQTGEKEL